MSTGPTDLYDLANLLLGVAAVALAPGADISGFCGAPAVIRLRHRHHAATLGGVWSCARG